MELLKLEVTSVSVVLLIDELVSVLLVNVLLDIVEVSMVALTMVEV